MKTCRYFRVSQPITAKQHASDRNNPGGDKPKGVLKALWALFLLASFVVIGGVYPCAQLALPSISGET
jgi:hypothetical protein